MSIPMINALIQIYFNTPLAITGIYFSAVEAHIFHK